MIAFESVPLWMMFVSMLALTALGAGGMSVLMESRASKIRVLAWVPVAGLLFLGLAVVLKRNSLHHVMLLYDDLMIVLGCLALVAAFKLRRLRRERARKETGPIRLTREDGQKIGVVAAMTASFVLVAVLAAEYLLAYQHQL